MTKTSLTANQPRFSIRTYSLGAASVLLAHACLAAGPVASANTTTSPATSPTIAQTTSSSAISQKTNTQTQTNTNRNRLTTQARTTSTRSSSTSALGDDYPYTAVDAIDPWRLYTRQCTSFVAFRLSKVNGFEIPPAYGNADVWGYRAQREGYRVDMSPAVGSVAWWTSPMHVAWVSSIQGDMVEIEEYNYGTRYTYNRRLIHKNSVSGYIHFKDLAGSPVSQTSPAPTQTHTSGLANSGTYTFTQQAPIKNEAKQSSTTLNYYYAGESVRYDRVLTADGYQWISYVSYSGQRRYIPIKQIQTSPTPQQTNKNLPSSGTYTFSSKAVVRNSPSQSASEITYYGAGSSVRYDRVVTSEGRTWISYISYSGARRYIAIP
ncbi:TPA: SH3 domain-containing protein [Streptococcus suis]